MPNACFERQELSDSLFELLLEDTVHAISAIHPRSGKRGTAPLVQSQLIRPMA